MPGFSITDNTVRISSLMVEKLKKKLKNYHRIKQNHDSSDWLVGFHLGSPRSFSTHLGQPGKCIRASLDWARLEVVGAWQLDGGLKEGWLVQVLVVRARVCVWIEMHGTGLFMEAFLSFFSWFVKMLIGFVFFFAAKQIHLYVLLFLLSTFLFL